MKARALCLLVVITGVGCSSIPPGGDPAKDPRLLSLARLAQPTLGRVAVAPIQSITLAEDEGAKGWSVAASPVIEANRIRDAFASALTASGSWDRVRTLDQAGLSDAWRERDEFVATLAIEELRVSYDGRNKWFIPNLINWFVWMVPAWWVATEDYSLTLEGELTVTSVESGVVLSRERIEVRVEGAFDEFDRGWHYFGFIYTPLDAERWLRIAGKLFPAAQLELAVRAAQQADTTIRKLAASDSYRERTRKTLVLALGVSRYADSARFPALPYAASDARALGSFLVDRGVAKPEQVLALTEADLTRDAVASAVREHLGRARDGDSVLVYFAGYGTRNERGEPALLLHDGAGLSSLSLGELGQLLSTVKGETLVVVDAAFDRGQRAVEGGRATGADDLAELGGVAAILASGTQQPALSQEHLGHGLLTYHLLGGLSGGADTDRDGRVTARELFDFSRPAVVAEAALVGEAQVPRAGGLLSGFHLALASDPANK